MLPIVYMEASMMQLQGLGRLLPCAAAVLGLSRPLITCTSCLAATQPSGSGDQTSLQLQKCMQQQALQIRMFSALQQQSITLYRSSPFHAVSHHQLARYPAGMSLQYSAVADRVGSDEDSASVSSIPSAEQTGFIRSSMRLDQQHTSRQPKLQPQAHQQQHVGQLHYLAGAQHQQTVEQQHQHVHHPRYQGHLHTPHGRRHSTSRSHLDRFISEQLMLCKSLGMLRRIMIKHKATMEPEHVADTMLCLQHLVRAARHARHSGVRTGLPFARHATSQARSQPRVRAAGELSRSELRTSESDGHAEQLTAQMLGELGSMTWFMMGDMTGPDLAKVLYSWATLDWHPEPELLADVTASFLATAASGGVQQPASTQDNPGPQQPGQQQSAELELWQGPWMAAGLWGLMKLGEPCEGQVLQLLQQHWQQLASFWTPDQLADVAGAVCLTADERMAAIAIAGSGEGETGQFVQEEEQLADIVLGLCQQMLSLLSARQYGDGTELLVPLPWPESMLLQVQATLLSASGLPTTQQAASGADSGVTASTVSITSAETVAPVDVPLMVVHNAPQLAWRMLQALAAVGVNVSEPEDQVLGALVANLSAATKVPAFADAA